MASPLLTARALARPKPLYYRPDFLDDNLSAYLAERGLAKVEEVEPDDFVRWIFPRLVAWRIPRYEALAERYGVTIDAARIQQLEGEEEVVDLVCEALDMRNRRRAAGR